MFCPYPPGIPVVAPGRLLNGAIVDYLARDIDPLWLEWPIILVSR
jgi:hypothetical protein